MDEGFFENSFGDRGKGNLKSVLIIIDFQIRDLLFLRIIKGMGKF